MKIKFRHRSFCVRIVVPTYCSAAQAHTGALGDEETQIVVDGLHPGTHGDGSITYVRWPELALEWVIFNTTFL